MPIPTLVVSKNQVDFFKFISGFVFKMCLFKKSVFWAKNGQKSFAHISATDSHIELKYLVVYFAFVNVWSKHKTIF